MIVAHTVNTERHPVPHAKYRMTVRVAAQNTTPAMAVFEAWIDPSGELQCVQC
jgi:hypothetical protein